MDIDLDLLQDEIDSKVDSSINMLALCRREKLCASVYLPDEKKVFVSMDLAGAEPNVMLNLTEDDMLKFFLKEAKGIAPYWNESTLMTDSMYITFASRNIVGRALINEAFERDWNGKTFSEQYLEDSDVIKKWLDSHGKAYGMYKMLTLALLYGLGGKGVVRQLMEYGVNLSEKQGYEIYNSFWSMFSGVDSFQKQLQKHLRVQKFLTNPLGFKLNCKPRNVLNAYIQSFVSSFISNLLIALDEYKKAEYIATIHDEIIFSIKEEDIPEFLEFRNDVLRQLNEAVGFKYPLELGRVEGKNFYEAK